MAGKEVSGVIIPQQIFSVLIPFMLKERTLLFEDTSVRFGSYFEDVSCVNIIAGKFRGNENPIREVPDPTKLDCSILCERFY